MRALILALLVAGPASAQAPESGEVIVITHAQFLQLKRDVEQMVRKREEAAFEAGKDAANVRCGKLI